MDNHVIDEWLKVEFNKLMAEYSWEVSKLMAEYSSKMRSARIKRGLYQRKERLGLVPKSS